MILSMSYGQLRFDAVVKDEIFYPALCEAREDTEDELNEAEVRHSGLKKLTEKIKAMEPQEELYDAKIKVLGECLDHHVAQDQADMLPKANASGIDFEKHGHEMKERKGELQLLSIDCMGRSWGH